MNAPTKLHCYLVACGLAAVFHGRAQSSIDWFTLDAGGGFQSSANYVVNFTAGQTDVGATVLSSASYRIIPGFWSLEDLGPATGLPQLTITLFGPRVILSWPSPSAGFVLQETDSLDVLPAVWGNTPGVVSDNGFTKSLTLSHNQAKRFYRLRRN
jgi:hypothetical protein